MPSTDRKGLVRWYVRRRGHKLVPMPLLPMDHPEFLAAYAKALTTTKVDTKVEKGTIAHLCVKALEAEALAHKSAGYRAMLRRHIDDIREKVGKAPAAGLRKKHIE